MKKKVIYRISKEKRPIVNVFNDGSIECLENEQFLHELYEGIYDDRLKIGRDFEEFSFEVALAKRNDTENERYLEAYRSVCYITGSGPGEDENGKPFNGFTVEYFGEGEPWERAVPEGVYI